MSHPYSDITEDQHEFIDWLKYRTEALGAMPISFGKTVCTLTALKELFEVHPDWTALVVSTKNIIMHTWPDEIRDWEHIDFSYSSFCKKVGRRIEALDEDSQIFGINFESLEWLLDAVDAGVFRLPEVLIIDESSKMKAHNANRVERLIHLTRGYVHRFERRWLLSATPAPEGMVGMWAQEACMSNRRRFGQNITSFRSEYCHMFGQAPATYYKVHASGEQRMQEKLTNVMYLPKHEKYHDRPDPTHSSVQIPWTDEAWAQYKDMEDDAIIEIETALEAEGDASMDEIEIVAPNAAAVCTKLRQLCSGFVYGDRNGGGRGQAHASADPDAKLEALAMLAERTGGSPLLVFTQFTHEMEMVGRAFKGAQLGMPDSLERWNDGGIPILCLHPASAGHGLNLQRGTNVCVFYSLPYSYEQWKQAWGRIDRTGQRRAVSVVRFERPGSIDLDVWRRVQGKGTKLSEFLGGMRARRAQR